MSNVFLNLAIIISYLIFNYTTDFLIPSTQAQEIDFSIWRKAKSTTNARRKISHEAFFKESTNCQKTSASCNISPYLPTGRDGHTTINFTSYNQTNANRMCLPRFCGPLCTQRNNDCYVNDKTGNDIPSLDPNTVLEGLLTSNNTSCPPNCCSTNNELCLRTYDVSGRKVEIDEELLLVFGGSNQIYVEEQEVNISDNCTAFDYLKKEPLEPIQKLNSLFLLNNCGILLLNDIWIYQVAKDEWFYLKPHIIELGKQKSQQIPQARMYHSAIYVERIDFNLMIEKRIVRKYMYIYGGFSLYCQNACDDFWNFEIAYAPQRYYPMNNGDNNSDNWKRGNKWTQIYSASSSNPGKRLKHSMVTDNEMNFAYLFGGVYVSETNNGVSYQLGNDLWSYEILSNKWTSMISLGITKLTRSILYWDGSKADIEITDKYLENNDKYDTSLSNYGDANFPVHRASAGMVYLQRSKKLLVIFGGYTNKTLETTNYQDQLDDIWAFSIIDYTWRKCYPNSDHNPSKRFGMGFVATSNKTLLMFGGVNSEKTLNDLWQFNIETNMWTEIKKSSLVSNDLLWPDMSQFSTLSLYSKGVILYGGSYYYDLSKYLNSILTNTTAIVPDKNQKKYYNDNLWFIDFTECDKTSCLFGTCFFGLCKCNNGYWGSRCDKPYCPGSFCYFDTDLLSSQVCYHCSGHGQCTSGKCICDSTWKGENCSIKDCKNNCSDGGICVESKPISQCDCDKMQKRGGDDCSTIYCLNNCSSKGTCDFKTGICKCHPNYEGENCSIFFRNLTAALLKQANVMLLILILIM